MFDRFFPASIFPRRLDEAAEKRLRLAQARAEEAIVRAHVDNALMFVDALAEDLSFDKAIETYVRAMGIAEPLASTVATRTLVVLGEEVVRFRRRGQEYSRSDDQRPRLRLDDAADRARSVKKGA